MPAHFAHYLLLRSVGDALSGDADLGFCSEHISQHSAFAAFGCLGPDILILNDPDLRLPGIDLTLPSPCIFYQQYLDYIYPITRGLKSHYNGLSNWFHANAAGFDEGIWVDFKNAIEATNSVINTFVALDHVWRGDYFEFLEPVTRRYYDRTSRWTWTELAHYKKTGDFMQFIWNASEGDEELRAYAIGHLTHMTGDVVGHGFINRLVGGPYRHHWRRHIFIERVLDYQIWEDVKHEPLGVSAAHEHWSFQGAELPDKLADFLAGAYAHVYGDISIASAPPSATAIKRMYKLLYEWLEFTATAELPPPPPPLDIAGLHEALKEALRDLWNAANVTIGFTGPPTMLGLKEQLRSAVKRFDIIWKAIQKFVTVLGLIGSSLLFVQFRLALSTLLVLLYEAYQIGTFALALLAYIPPLNRHFRMGIGGLAKPSQTRDACYPSDNDLFSQYPHLSADLFPRLGVVPDTAEPLWLVTKRMQISHLVHPKRLWLARDGKESPLTGPFPRANQGYEESLLGDNHNYRFFDHEPADVIRGRTSNAELKVSAKKLTIEALRQLKSGGKIPNWNLDADRGFSWPEWSTNLGRHSEEIDFVFNW